MNMNTVTQELNKKVKQMNGQDFAAYVGRLCDVWSKAHRKPVGFALQMPITKPQIAKEPATNDDYADDFSR